MANEYLPIGISVANRHCLVVGGGAVALRKVDNLLEYEAKITVIAPDVDPKIKYYAERNRIELKEREYKSPEAATFGLVISASDDREVNGQVYDDAMGAGVPVNVVDKPKQCDFIFPAVTKRDCLTVSVSSDGRAPFLSGYLRLILDDIFPDRWTKIAKYAAEFRILVKKEGPEASDEKAKCFTRFLSADWKELLKDKSGVEIRSQMQEWLKG